VWHCIKILVFMPAINSAYDDNCKKQDGSYFPFHILKVSKTEIVV